jgi:hypothetical protein
MRGKSDKAEKRSLRRAPPPKNSGERELAVANDSTLPDARTPAIPKRSRAGHNTSPTDLTPSWSPRPDEGLLMLSTDHRSDDEWRVDHAEKRLVGLLSTPYYHEAYLRLLRKKHPVVANKPGILPLKKGALAARYQSPNPTIPKKKGRKALERPEFERLLDIAERRRWKIASVCLAYLGLSQYPIEARLRPAEKGRLRKDAHELAQKVRNYKKRLRGKNSA